MLSILITFFVIFSLVSADSTQSNQQHRLQNFSTGETESVMGDVSVPSTTAPSISWERCYGGIYNDWASDIQQTNDGGYIVTGDKGKDQGYGDYFFNLKLDAAGDSTWEQDLWFWSVPYSTCVSQTSDGGYIVAGHVSGSNMAFVEKLASTGAVEWYKVYTTDHYYKAINSIQQTSDGGYIVAGRDRYRCDCWWISKLNNTGEIQWVSYPSGLDRIQCSNAKSIQLLDDGGYIVAGYTNKNDGNVSGNHGGYDEWVVNLNSAGSIRWQKCLGGTLDDQANAIQKTSDSGYIVAGWTNSTDGDVSGNHGVTDAWVVKLSSTGTIEWQKCLGGSLNDQATGIQQTSDDGYIVGGYSFSNDGDVSGNHGNGDYWVVKLSSTGTIEWQKCLGGSLNDQANSIQQTSEGGYIVAGVTNSTDGDVSGKNSLTDAWVVKLGGTPITKIGVFRPSTGKWYLASSSGSTFKSFSYGVSTDIPVVGDWNGDGIEEVGVFRPSTGKWYLASSSGTTNKSFDYGKNGDTPVVGVW